MDPNATRVNIEIGREMNLTEKKILKLPLSLQIKKSREIRNEKNMSFFTLSHYTYYQFLSLFLNECKN